MALSIASFAKRFRKLRELLWASLPWFWVSHHNHVQNFIVQLGSLLVATEQKCIAFQGTVTRREDQSKARMKTITTWSQDPLYQETLKPPVSRNLSIQNTECFKPENSSTPRQVRVISLPLWHSWNRIQSPLKSRVEFPSISEEPGWDPGSHCHTAAEPGRLQPRTRAPAAHTHPWYDLGYSSIHCLQCYINTVLSKSAMLNTAPR